MFKTPEEIRKEIGVSQKEFSSMVSSSFRTYQERISLEKPKWNIYEIVKLGKLNNGEVRLRTEDGEFDITISAR